MTHSQNWGVKIIQVKSVFVFPLSYSRKDENQRGKKGKGRQEADCSTEEEEGFEAGHAQEEGLKETDPVH